MIETLSIFKQHLLNKVRPKKNDYFGITDKEGTRYITMMRMGLSPLRRHKFDYNFYDTDDPICISGDGIEDNEHFLLHCLSFVDARTTLIKNVSTLTNTNFLELPNKKKIKILLYGESSLSNELNKMILIECITFVRKTGRMI